MCIWWWLGVKMRKLGFNKQSSQPQVADLSDIRQQIDSQTQNQESIQRQLDYIHHSELPNFVQKSDMLAINNELSGLRSELAEQKQPNNANNYVIKGENGTWAVNPTNAVINCYEPVVLGYYTQEHSRQNRPNGYGSLHSFSSQGHLTKQGGNWITTFAFGTDGRLFYVQSINGGQGGWNEIVTSQSRQVTIQSNGIQSGQNLSRGNGNATGFVKRWAKLNATAPSDNLPITINHPFARNKIVSLNYRIDGDNKSITNGLNVEIYDNYFQVVLNNQGYANKAVTFYVEYEP